MLELTLPTFSLGQYANLMAKADWPECLLNIGRSLDIKRITLKRCHKKIYSYTTIYVSFGMFGARFPLGDFFARTGKKRM